MKPMKPIRWNPSEYLRLDDGEYLVFLDVETTGVREDSKLLEIGIFDPHTGRESSWIEDKYDYAQLLSLFAKEPLLVLDMHVRSGLIAACVEANAQRAGHGGSAAWLTDTLNEWYPGDGKIYLGGINTHFDFGHVTKRCSRLSYRLIDLTTLRYISDMTLLKPLGKSVAHRGVDDCKATSDELYGYLNAIRSMTMRQRLTEKAATPE